MSNLLAIKQRFGIIGHNSLLDRALDTATRVASTDLSVLITGETGVGKEVFSRIIHALSPRKHNKFIAINCGAIPEGTINSELFGHVKGSFTGATTDRKGYFETVNGGTIFLDEIGEMPESTQQFLLRILENGEFIPVGSNKVLKTDVRIVAATNVKLRENIGTGRKFREDLYYRLSTVPITVPPLRERRGDIYLLFRKFATDFAEKYRMNSIRLEEKAVSLLENYPWPGNIRELKNVAEKISVLSQERFITAEDLIDYLPRITKRNLPVVATSPGSEGNNYQEREILYKLLFDMKGDLNQLKNLVSELIRINDLTVPDLQGIRQLQPALSSGDTYYDAFEDNFNTKPETARPIITKDQNNGEPIVISTPVYETTEDVEENLKLEDMEKILITKALKKHNGKRKDAAIELGISERTLYRKIDKYHIKE